MNEITNKFELLLSNTDIFKGLDKQAIKDISRRFQIERFKEGEKLIESGQQATSLYVIFNGNVELQTPNLLGHIKRQINLTDGSTLGEVSLLTNVPFSSDAVAIEKTVVFSLPREEFDILLEKYKLFSDTITRQMSKRMAQDGGINKVGRYTLTKKIGEGNMATVFEAYDPMLERNVAIKMLKYDLSHNQDFLDRFEHEAKVIAKLNHPNIVNVYESISEYSTRFIVMERLTGKDLDQVLKDKGPLSILETRNIMHQLAGAMQYAHSQGEKGIIHRDIKPANVIVDDHGNVKLTDFGIAKPPKNEVTMVLGSPKYLAPEIILGNPFDGQADIYSMGIMTFTLLTGTPPFAAHTLNELLSKQVKESPPDIKKYRPEIDNDLKKFIDDSLIKDPKERISDWKIIKVLLRPGAKRDLSPVDNDEIAFVTRIHNNSYQNVAMIINKLI
ncbi:MAG: protein kinase, partial [Thiotrichaceae bacterium]|nr:protein kinase [Thiotrichaceae bacterium]